MLSRKSSFEHVQHHGAHCWVLDVEPTTADIGCTGLVSRQAELVQMILTDVMFDSSFSSDPISPSGTRRAFIRGRV